MSALTHLNLKALTASHRAHYNLTSSTLAGRGSQTSLSSSSSSIDRSSHNHHHHFHHSLHLRSRVAHWREQIWTHHTNRSERIALGYPAPGRRVLTTVEMELQMESILEVTRGFGDCLPVADATGGFVGWRVKAATFPRTMGAQGAW